MKLTRRKLNAGGLALLAAGSLGPAFRASAAASEGLVANLPEADDRFVLATDAYIYAYPLVTMEMTRRVITNVAEPKGTRAPMGQLIKLRQYPDAKFRDVTAPNADTLYTTAFFDVGDEPWVVSLPDLNGRYALFSAAGRLDHRVRRARQAHDGHGRADLHRDGARLGRDRAARDEAVQVAD